MVCPSNSVSQVFYSGMIIRPFLNSSCKEKFTLFEKAHSIHGQLLLLESSFCCETKNSFLDLPYRIRLYNSRTVIWKQLYASTSIFFSHSQIPCLILLLFMLWYGFYIILPFCHCLEYTLVFQYSPQIMTSKIDHRLQMWFKLYQMSIIQCHSNIQKHLGVRNVCLKQKISS